ncbi:hypothetical protein [Streptomyces benahoarensis]|uniref:hypothetical protein n=1 Tax=Streptomyces benahoarensis TaxID=2595054 RepID=UPI00163DD086|nr:hypothetical protein [Streptomyces benahoarensis]
MSSAEHTEPLTKGAPGRSPSPVRQLAAASVGDAVEWYDWFSCTHAQEVYLSAPYLHRCRSA